MAVGMSGGIDSSVAAYLLKKEGYDVTGFHLKLFRGCEKESLESARDVAKKLKIPFYAIDAKVFFKKWVIDDFIGKFKNNLTPNPCVSCNKLIKFGWFLKFCESRGFKKIATGHYCRTKKDQKGAYHLLKGVDPLKDQSYFLYCLSQKQLSKVIFSLGKYTKKEVREIARKNKINLKSFKESQEICFVQEDNHYDFLLRHLAKKHFKEGNIVDIKGKILGRHKGLPAYTIGQRKGIETIGIKDENKKPLYVIGFNPKKNELIVGEDKEVFQKEMKVKNLSWTGESARKYILENQSLKVSIRYHHKPVSCKITAKGKVTKVTFTKPQRAVTPGQSAVFYRGNEVLGGGTIG